MAARPTRPARPGWDAQELPPVRAGCDRLPERVAKRTGEAGICLGACLETTRGAAARDFGCGQGGFGRAQRPQRAVRNEPTPATDKRPAARRVFGEKAVWLRPARECFRSCSVVAARSASFVAPSGLFPENSAPRSFQTGSYAAIRPAILCDLFR